MLIGLILLSVALAALAQLTLKHGMNEVTANTGELQLNAHSLKDVLTTLGGMGRVVPVRPVGVRVARGAVPCLAVVRLSVRLAVLRVDPASRQVHPAGADPGVAVGRRVLHHDGHRAGGADAALMTTDPGAAELAVVIVNFNTGDYLERCLASLEAHRGDIELDVLVIDNASHDGSHTRAVAAHPRARLIENPTNVFLSPAWNQGIRETKAPWVLLLNPDIEWWAGTLADYVAVAKAHPDAGIVGPLVRNSDGTIYPRADVRSRRGRCRRPRLLGNRQARQSLHERYHLDGWDRRSEREVDWVSGCCMLVPRAAFDRVGHARRGVPALR